VVVEQDEMLVISPDDLRVASGGVSLKRIANPELAEYIAEAQDLAATYVNQDTLLFHQTEQIVQWRGENLRFHLMHAPIRTILGYRLLTGAFQGQDTFVGIDDTPAPTTGSPTVLPTNLGGIKIIRTINGGDASSFLSAVGVGSTIGDSMQIEQEITYTAGYDDGTVQPDGYSIPFPRWLKTAVRLIAVDLLGDWESGRRGMAGLQQMRIADAVWRKPTNRSKDEIVIPLKAKAILDRHYRPWITG
jgi:hypothetical protein